MSNPEDLQAELERLRAENSALKKTSAKGLSLKVSEKGALSIYGLGRFPVGDDTFTATIGQVVWSPAGVPHGVSNDSDTCLTLLVGIAPAP